MRMVVDFPAPLGPRKPTTWPRSTAKETWSTAVTPPNRLETPSTERKGIPASECVYRRCDANHTPRHSSSPPYSDLRNATTAARSGAGARDRLLDAAGPSVVEERLGITQVE